MRALAHPHRRAGLPSRFVNDTAYQVPLAVATRRACETMGMPECKLVVAHCVAYLARAPKSIAILSAYSRAEAAVAQRPRYAVPKHICNASTAMMKQLGYKAGYIYPPEWRGPMPAGYSYLPPALATERFWREEELSHGRGAVTAPCAPGAPGGPSGEPRYR